MAQIEDGKGTGNRAQVNDENQLVVRAVTESGVEHESEVNGIAYNWSSDIVSIDAADTVLLVKNTSDTHLHIEYVEIANGATASEYTLHLPTVEVTLSGGSVVTGTNLNTASSNVADALSRSDEEGNTQGNVIGTVWLAIDRNYRFLTPGLILGKNKSIGIDIVAASAETAATIVGHYED